MSGKEAVDRDRRCPHESGKAQALHTHLEMIPTRHIVKQGIDTVSALPPSTKLRSTVVAAADRGGAAGGAARLAGVSCGTAVEVAESSTRVASSLMRLSPGIDLERRGPSLSRERTHTCLCDLRMLLLWAGIPKSQWEA